MGTILVRKMPQAGAYGAVVILPNDPPVSRLEGVATEIGYTDISPETDLHDLCGAELFSKL